MIHPIKPVYNNNSRILILGSFPSVKSREDEFFYAHPQNRFWKLLADIFEADTPTNTEEKRKFLLSNNIALWDVIGSCDVTGSSDSSIKNVVPNDLSIILETAKIEKIFLNGKTAFKYYNRYMSASCSIAFECLPSSSPANASWSYESLKEAWSVIRTT